MLFVLDFNVFESIKCSILNIIWDFKDGEVFNIRFLNKIRCFFMRNEFLDNLVFF